MTFPDASNPATPTLPADGEVPLRVESPWGTVIVFWLWQTFGTIIADAFVYTLTDLPNDEIGLVVWNLFWIFLFIAAENQLVSETRRFLSHQGVGAFAAPRSPLERIKLVLALLSVAAWLVCFFACPFPALRPHRLLSLAFLAFSFLVAALVKVPLGPYRRITVPRMDSLPELLYQLILVGTVCAGLIAGGLVLGSPLGFYLFSFAGFGLLLLFASPILLRATLLTSKLEPSDAHNRDLNR